MNNSTPTPPHPPLHRAARPLLATAGAGFVLSTAVLALVFREDPDDTTGWSPAADAQDPIGIASYYVATVACGLLLLAVAGLSSHRGPGGRGLPVWAAVLGLLGAAGGCVTYVAEAVYVAYFAGLAPDTYDAAYTRQELVGGVAGVLPLVTFAAGFAALGIAGWRTGLFRRLGSVLLVFSSLAILTVGPVVIGLAGIGLLVAARKPSEAPNSPLASENGEVLVQDAHRTNGDR